ncbi:hypothetical protein FB45DRAFT_133838 [Roridomyces roridus]|uniref:Uncharacterized protein n=1 Tax=Roridomyces roridus TaxID=1738132 RepID=A0AAD7FFE5_9AGAR|nr:hypothetical protein FB45DRAFT_133838 [Roridomyces roridus]
MFKFMAWSFSDYERSHPKRTAGMLGRVSAWLTHTSLFEQAWARVCFGRMNWWWSQQLCLFTVGAWTIFLATEGNRHQVRRVWAYMLLGQLVAISVASNLFYLSLVLAPPPPSTRSATRWASPILWLPVIVSLAAVARSPLTDEKSFLPNLLVMHAAIVLPLFAPATSNPTRRTLLSIPLPALYFLVFVVSLVLHSRTTASQGMSAVPEFVGSAWSTLHEHPAQSSIGWDVLWTSVSFVAWLVLQPEQDSKILTGAYLLLATPLVSVGVLAPHVLRPREEEAEADVKKDE